MRAGPDPDHRRHFTENVPVPPGEEGYAFSEWPTVTWSGTLTDNQNIRVTNFTLTYPGYGSDNFPAIVTGATSKKIGSEDAKSCGTLIPSFKPGLRAARGLAISVCVAGVRGCEQRFLDLINASRLLAGNATVELVHGSRVYASGTDRNGVITLHAARRLGRGVYSVFINRRGKETIATAVLH